MCEIPSGHHRQAIRLSRARAPSGSCVPSVRTGSGRSAAPSAPARKRRQSTRGPLQEQDRKESPNACRCG
eukprot:6189202-Pleurochrysis_carterae.AAC.1